MLKITNTVHSAFQPHSLWLVRFLSVRLYHPFISTEITGVVKPVFSSIQLSLPALLPYTTLYLTHPYSCERLKNRL